MIDARTLFGTARRALRTGARLARAIVGVPDYEAYLAHTRDRHPECAPLTRDEFARDRLAARYDRPGSRCC